MGSPANCWTCTSKPGVLVYHMTKRRPLQNHVGVVCMPNTKQDSLLGVLVRQQLPVGNWSAQHHGPAKEDLGCNVKASI